MNWKPEPCWLRMLTSSFWNFQHFGWGEWKKRISETSSMNYVPFSNLSPFSMGNNEWVAFTLKLFPMYIFSERCAFHCIHCPLSMVCALCYRHLLIEVTLIRQKRYVVLTILSSYNTNLLRWLSIEFDNVCQFRVIEHFTLVSFSTSVR